MPRPFALLTFSIHAPRGARQPGLLDTSTFNSRTPRGATATNSISCHGSYQIMCIRHLTNTSHLDFIKSRSSKHKKSARVS